MNATKNQYIYLFYTLFLFQHLKETQNEITPVKLNRLINTYIFTLQLVDNVDNRQTILLKS